MSHEQDRCRGATLERAGGDESRLSDDCRKDGP
jgi:hypothetical protein